MKQLLKDFYWELTEGWFYRVGRWAENVQARANLSRPARKVHIEVSGDALARLKEELK